MKDNVMPTKKWEFNEEVTECFEEMLERSIPAYSDMRALVEKLGKNFVQPKTSIIDLGCSTGEAIKPFIRYFGAQNQYKLYDVSDPMLKKCEEKYSGWIDCGLMEVRKFDIREGLLSFNSSSLILSVLTLQFIPIEYRQKIVQSIYNALIPGGCFILVEKVLGINYKLDSMFVKEYYALKKENSYSEEQISAKRKSLEGVLVPITAKWNEGLLKSAGFNSVDCFYRYLNFAGWIAIK